jgi:FtsH-binding integral membrane protein
VSDTQGYTPAPPIPVADAAVDVRFDFMKKVYGLLLGGIAAFIGLEVLLFATGIAEVIYGLVVQTNWLLILAGFMLLNWLASTFAVRAETRQGQIGAFAITVVAQALIFVPMFYVATTIPELDGAIGQAAAISTVAFVGLTGVAITSARDFSFLGSILKWVGISALLLIVLAVFTGLNLGAWFSVGMIFFAGAAILWETQQVLREYPEGTEVLAAMQLFASVALLFWYVLRLVMAFGRD